MGSVSASAAVVGGQFTPAVKRMMAAELIAPKQWLFQLAIVAVVCSAYKPLCIITGVLGYKTFASITDSWQYP